MSQWSARVAHYYAELRRRKVVRVSIAYGVFAAATIQLADPLTEALGLPRWTLTAVVVVAALGLPLAVVLAWMFDITRESAGAARAANSDNAGQPAAPMVYEVPAPLTPLVGREDDVERALAFLRQPDCRVLTITGPGGIGKTRLAEEIATRLRSSYRDGVCFVALAGVDAVEALPAALADALGFDLSPQQKAARQLATFLQEKNLLLILDNFEQIVDGAALLTEIVARAPEVRVLVTSRRRLRIARELVLPLDALSLPHSSESLHDSDSGRFFLQIARRNQPEFQPDASATDAIVRICHIAGGVPLAIELAGASVGVLTCEEIAAELEQSHELLVGARRDLPPRHRSLHAVFESSWRLLDREERRVLRRLSVFRSGFDTDDAAHIAGAGMQLLGRLVEASLLQRPAQRGFEMLEVLRQFAEEKLDGKPEEAEAARNAHSAYFLGHLAGIAELPDERDKNAAIERLAYRHADLRAAWLRAVADVRHNDLRRAAPAMFRLLEARGRSAEGVQLFGRAISAVRRLDADGEAVQSTLARLLTRYAAFLTDVGELSDASAHLDEALAILGREGDRTEIAFALHRQCIIARSGGAFHATAFTECLELYRELGHVPGIARALNSAGAAAWSRGEYEAAERMYEESIALFRRSGLEAEAWAALNNLAGVATVRGDWARARRILEDELDAARKRMNPRALSYLLTNLGYISSRSGDPQAARAYLEEGAQLARAMGYRALLAYSLNSLAAVQLQDADVAEARRSYRDALEVAIDAEEGPLVTTILVGLARLYLRVGDRARAALLLAAAHTDPSSDEETRTNARALLEDMRADTDVAADVPLDRAIQVALEPEGVPLSV